MGSDAVDIILRTEEFFGIVIEDEEAAAVRTVGDFYILVCSKLGVKPSPTPRPSEVLPKVTDKEKVFLFLTRHSPLPPPPEVLPWSPQSVWDCLVSLLADQQGLDTELLRFHARFLEDLGVD